MNHSSFDGEYWNVDAETESITRFDFAEDSDGVFVGAWGACFPEECEWGDTALHLLGDENALADASHAFATWDSTSEGLGESGQFAGAVRCPPSVDFPVAGIPARMNIFLIGTITPFVSNCGRIFFCKFGGFIAGFLAWSMVVLLAGILPATSRSR